MGSSFVFLSLKASGQMATENQELVPGLPEGSELPSQTQPMDTTRIAVVGAGVIGLSTALCVTQMVPRCSVTLISDKFTPDTNSDVAAGILIPHAYPDMPVHTVKRWFRETFDHLSAIARSADAVDAGVHLVSGWQIFQNIPTEEVPFWADVVLGFRKMTEAELMKFPQYVFGHAFTTLKCETSAYLPWMERRLQGGGNLLVTRRIEDLWELQPAMDVVVNCSGLGSQQLAGDSTVSPVRGQVLQVQAPWLKHFIRDGSGLPYIYPGASYVTLGGTRQQGDWDLSPDAEISRQIFSRCCSLEPSLRRARAVKEKVGLRPSRPGVCLQKEILSRGGQKLFVVHNYGHGSGGISVHWGSALEASRLVTECIEALRTSATTSKL